MRKALVLGFVASFIAAPALACGWGAKTASDQAKQTVMTDQAAPTKTKSSGG